MCTHKIFLSKKLDGNEQMSIYIEHLEKQGMTENNQSSNRKRWNLESVYLILQLEIRNNSASYTTQNNLYQVCRS